MISEVAVKELGYAARTSEEFAAATLISAGIAAGNLLCTFPFLERTGKKLSCAIATGEMAGEQKEGPGFREGAFYTTSWDGASADKVTWEGSASTGCNLIVIAFTGAHATTPMDVTAVWGTFTSTAAPVAPSITTVTAKALQGVLVIPSSAATLKSEPAGFAKFGNYIVTKERETAGATGTTTLELTEAASGVVLSFAIRPKEEAKSSPTLSMVI